MAQPRSFPPIKPLTRLQVIDGLEITVDRWNTAHNYHQQRQNIHYQALNQAGIIHGLGVCVIDAPEDVSVSYRDRRWVQIQPGIAIDYHGNVIVVPEAIDFRIVSETINNLPRTVYLVITYVDPEQLYHGNQTEVTETFRIDEKSQPPTLEEIELCRLQLTPGEVSLDIPHDVFFPQPQSLDLRYRLQVRSHPDSLVRIAMLDDDYQQYPNKVDCLNRLLHCVRGLYAGLAGDEQVGRCSSSFTDSQGSIFAYDLLYLTKERSQQLSQAEVTLLKNYLMKGGVILIEFSIHDSKIEELRIIESELLQAKERIEAMETMADTEEQIQIEMLTQMKPMVEAELREIRKTLGEEIAQVMESYSQFKQQLNCSLNYWENLHRDHPLRYQPFLFSALPTINRLPLQLLTGGGLIIIIGDISFAWGYDQNLNLSRETIRTAQEFGINLLHFAYRRGQMTNALGSFSS